MRSSRSDIFAGESDIVIPTTDIVSYAFGEYGKYDLDKPIYVDGLDSRRFISARSARKIVRQLVNGLKAQGVQAGDCVCLHAYNNIYYPLLWLGIIGANCRVSGSNPSCTVPELERHLRTASAKFIITQTSCLTSVDEAARECGIPSSRIFALDSPSQQLPDGCLSWKVLLECGESDWEIFPQDDTKASAAVAVLSATSGTTGLPKSAAISHKYLVSQCAMIQKHIGARQYEVSQLVCLPLFHMFAAQVGLVLPLRKDTTVVPPIIASLLKMPSTGFHLLRSLRYLVCAGAPMNARLQTKLYDHLAPNAVIAQNWGTTETGWTTLFKPDEKDTSGSVGRLLPNVRMKIVGQDGGAISQDNVRGEAFIWSPSVFSEYLLQKEASDGTLDSEGFFRTGDLVFMRDGKLFVAGRIKDVMKVNGWQVSPEELEVVILEHPQVLDVAVVGVPYNNAGIQETRPRAYIVLKPTVRLGSVDSGTESTVDELAMTRSYVSPPHSPLITATNQPTQADFQTYVAARVISYKNLTGGVRFVDSIPRSGTGKILRRLLPTENPGSTPEPLSNPLQSLSSHKESPGTDRGVT